MAKSPFRPDLKGSQAAAFRIANPKPFGRAQGNVKAVEQMAAIERRAEKIKERVRAHFLRHKETWVAKEAISLWLKRAVPAHDHPRPVNGAPVDVSGAYLNQARRNVVARMSRRLSDLNATKTRLQNAVVRSHPTVSASPARNIRPTEALRHATKPKFTNRTKP